MVIERRIALSEQKLGREGHRKRMREQYLSGAMDNAPDHNLLEIFLSVVIPRHDVKDLSYDLINTFGSLEGVVNASPLDLMTVKGVGESTAVAISSIRKIYERVVKNRNHNIKKIKNINDARRFCINELSNEVIEKVIQVNMKNDGTVINVCVVGTGTVNYASINIHSIVQNACRNNAAYVLLAHNHPGGDEDPSAHDIDFTLRIKNIFDGMRINFLDHMIVAGEKCEPIIGSPFFHKSSNNKKK